MTLTEELNPALRRNNADSHDRQERNGLDGMGIGELSLSPCLRVLVPEKQTDQLHCSLGPLSYPIFMSSDPSLTCWRLWRHRSYGLMGSP